MMDSKAMCNRLVIRLGWVFGLLCAISIQGEAQEEAGWSKRDSVMVAEIHGHVLGSGQCYEDLRVLCKDIGARLSQQRRRVARLVAAMGHVRRREKGKDRRE